MLIIILMPILAVSIKLLSLYLKYKDSDYKMSSGNSFFKTIFDMGNYGEFLTFICLEKLGEPNKIMTNLYIPREDGTTTEIDLIMISETGIYVFESKNYSGWIFGDEKNKNWTQTLENRQENRFYNPIWQNKAHINALKWLISVDDDSLNNDDLYRSYIVFSERCTLKKINVISPNVKVIKRNQLNKSVKNDIENAPKLLSIDDINRLYSGMQKYANVDESTKRAHIEGIKARRA